MHISILLLHEILRLHVILMEQYFRIKSVFNFTG